MLTEAQNAREHPRHRCTPAVGGRPPAQANGSTGLGRGRDEDIPAGESFVNAGLEEGRLVALEHDDLLTVPRTGVELA